MAIAGLLLAAGASERLGRNKLLLRLGGESLLRRAARSALAAGLDPVIAVLGHEAERAAEELTGLRCAAVVNPRHAEGMNGSIDAGVAAVPPGAEALVMLLADMPLAGEEAVRAVVTRWRETGAPIVSSRYGGTPAPPVLYARSLFAELRGGSGEGRGRELVRRHGGRVRWADWSAEALADVDDEEGWGRVRRLLGEGGER